MFGSFNKVYYLCTVNNDKQHIQNYLSMEGLSILVAVIGVGLLLAIGAAMWAFNKILDGQEELFGYAKDSSKIIMDLQQRVKAQEDLLENIITNLHKKEGRIGNIEAALFQAQLGERLSDAERFTRLVDVKETESGVEIIFKQDESDPQKFISVVKANNFITI